MLLRRKLLLSSIGLFVLLSSLVVSVQAQSSTMWSQTYGGIGDDAGTGDTVQTSEGGYALSGDTDSFGAGGLDFWLIKTDEFGNMQWNQTYGGALDEISGEMCQTTDGGYAMAGGTYSFGVGDSDFWLVKTDSSGNMQWNNTYGGADYDYGWSVVQTSDGGYALFGVTESFGVGGEDFYLVKTDSSGNMQWNMTYGGTENDHGTSMVQSSDGGYAVTGYTNSFGAGNTDFWLVKTDSSGNMQWNMTYGGTGFDNTYQLKRTNDGGYAMGGLSTSFGQMTAFLVKTDEFGNMQWNKTFGVTIGNSIIQTVDGGFAIAGYTMTSNKNFYLAKTDAVGNLQWNMTYGGTGYEDAYSVIQTADGGYALTGSTASFGAGGNDIWLVKVDEFGVIPEYSSWLLQSLLLTAILFIVICKKKLFSQTGKQ
jgi:predicted secreted protein